MRDFVAVRCARRQNRHMIYYDKVTKVYNGGQHAVEEVTLTVNAGEFVSIVGHSGAGKTTLLKMLFAEVTPTEGVVYFGSNDVSALSNVELLKMRQYRHNFPRLPAFAYQNDLREYRFCARSCWAR